MDVGGNRGANGVGAVRGGDAGGDSFARLNGLGECGAEARGVLLRHGKEAQIVRAFLGEGEADESTTVAGHEVDGFRGDMLGGQSEVALVFAIFVVDDDHHAAGANFVERAGDVDEGWLEFAWTFWHGELSYSRLSQAESQKRKRKGGGSGTQTTKAPPEGDAFAGPNCRNLQGRFNLKAPGFKQGLRDVLRVLVPTGPLTQTGRPDVLIRGELELLDDLFEGSHSGHNGADGLRLAPIRISTTLCHLICCP